MSLQPQEIAPVPEETQQVARAAFPQGNWYVRLRDEIGTIFDDPLFAPWFPTRGHPAVSPWRLALITVMHFDFAHNPFSMPQGGMEALERKDPLDIYAFQYDLVCNGFELTSGAIRNHKPEIMYKAFEIAGYSKEKVDEKFGHMIRAFEYGAPPHGGYAPGIDRLLMVINDWNSIRDIYAFPKDGQGRDVMLNAPSEIDDKQLIDLGIKIVEE